MKTQSQTRHYNLLETETRMSAKCNHGLSYPTVSLHTEYWFLSQNYHLAPLRNTTAYNLLSNSYWHVLWLLSYTGTIHLNIRYLCIGLCWWAFVYFKWILHYYTSLWECNTCLKQAKAGQQNISCRSDAPVSELWTVSEASQIKAIDTSTRPINKDLILQTITFSLL